MNNPTTIAHMAKTNPAINPGKAQFSTLLVPDSCDIFAMSSLPKTGVVMLRASDAIRLSSVMRITVCTACIADSGRGMQPTHTTTTSTLIGMTDKLGFMRRLNLFEQMGESEVEQISKELTMRHCRAHQTVFEDRPIAFTCSRRDGFASITSRPMVKT